MRINLGLTRSAILAAISFGLAGVAQASTPSLVIDVDSGQVLLDDQATAIWYPASLTKLMTAYVALNALKAGRLTLDTPLVTSARAARMPPSKMGFRPGVQVTLDNALKMLMVKSPNDVAVTIAEGVSGSVEAFADEMNAAGRRLGLHESHFVNPNGLADPSHVSSARDMAIIGRALLREFPEHSDLFGIGALQLGDHVIANHNGLLGRYPGADGMKTGFTCAAGFNVVASATQGGRRLIAVVMGANSAKERTAQAAALFDRGFSAGGGSGDIRSLPSPGIGPAPNMRQQVCRRRSPAELANAEDEDTSSPIVAIFGKNSIFNAMFGGSGGGGSTGATYSQAVHFDPVPVFVGAKPGWNGPVLAARAPGHAPKDTAAPASATAYAPQKPQVLDTPTQAPGEAADAPMALQGAVENAAPVAAIRASAAKAARLNATKKNAAPKYAATAAKNKKKKLENALPGDAKVNP